MMTKDEMRILAEKMAEEFDTRLLKKPGFYDKQRSTGINKAGVIPVFYQDGAHYFYLIKPTAAHEEDLGDPGFQIPKGTREVRDLNGEWVNFFPTRRIKYTQMEPLIVAALREGIEEIGLKQENIKTLYEWGIADFESATSGKPKAMWLYAAMVENPEDFTEPDSVHANTEERAWFDIQSEDAQTAIRSDHLKILKDIARKLPNNR